MSTVGVDKTDPPPSWAEAIRSAPASEPGPWRQRGLKSHPQCPGSPQASNHRTKQKPLQPTCASLTNFFTLLWEGRVAQYAGRRTHLYLSFTATQRENAHPSLRQTRPERRHQEPRYPGCPPGGRVGGSGAGRRERSRRALTLCGMEAAGSPCPHTSFSFSPPRWAARTSSFETAGESEQIALLS